MHHPGFPRDLLQEPCWWAGHLGNLYFWLHWFSWRANAIWCVVLILELLIFCIHPAGCHQMMSPAQPNMGLLPSHIQPPPRHTAVPAGAQALPETGAAPTPAAEGPVQVLHHAGQLRSAWGSQRRGMVPRLEPRPAAEWLTILRPPNRKMWLGDFSTRIIGSWNVLSRKGPIRTESTPGPVQGTTRITPRAFLMHVILKTSSHMQLCWQVWEAEELKEGKKRKQEEPFSSLNQNLLRAKLFHHSSDVSNVIHSFCLICTITIAFVSTDRD